MTAGEDLISRMKVAKPVCRQCTYLAERVDGAVQSETNNSWIIRCSVCSSTYSYPWASELNAEKVEEFLKANPNAFDVAVLKSLL